MIRKHWGGDLIVKKTLSSLWKKFGTVSDVFYDDEFTYCFLSFSTHEEAAAVLLSDLNSNSLVQAKGVELSRQAQSSGNNEKAQRNVIIDQIISHLVVNACYLSANRASWARPKRSRDDYHDNDHYNDHEYFDDCPDGEDRDVWNSYCEGRSD